jgi:gliding motility-associated-like protein
MHLFVKQLRRITATAAICLSVQQLSAQTDTEFWFVAPEITSGHGDSPIVLRVSANELPADIVLSQPATNAFTPIVLTIPAGTTQTIDLTPFKDLLENQPPDQVLDKGLLLQSSVPVTAYYEVNYSNNPEIFALKGTNALGTEFYTPFSTNYDNGIFTPAARSGFEIVATEDSTTITITPTANLIGHPAGVPFSINLNRGQSYSLVAESASGALHPAGTHITSNKPIAVTLKDDSATFQGCRDLLGDQLVPVSMVGTDYIVMKGFLNPGGDRAYVLATADSTEIFIDGSLTPIDTLNSGEQFIVDIVNSSVFISGSKPIYVLHVTGVGCEMGSAVLPSIECTGSSTVSFTRSNAEVFRLNIMVRSGSEGSFTLNGSTTLVPASAFTPVNGTGGVWLSAQLAFTTANIAVGATSVLKNTAASSELFHLGIINGSANGGCRYGYFSDFASTNLGSSGAVCSNDSLLLDAGPGKDSYLWNTGDTTQFIYVQTPGMYWVIATKDGCQISDTIDVFQDFPDLNLPDTLVGCDVSSLTLSPAPGYYNFIWNNGSTTSDIDVSETGIYFLEATSLAGCLIRDTVMVNFESRPPAVNPLIPSEVCSGSNVILNSQGAIGTVYWEGPLSFIQTGESIQIETIVLAQSGIYYASQQANGCRSDSVAFEISVQPSVELSFEGDTLLCEGETSLITISGADSVLWSNGQTVNALELGAGDYEVFSTRSIGCNDTLAISLVNAKPDANFTAIPETITTNEVLALSDASATPAGTTLTAFVWNFAGYPSLSGESTQISFSDSGLVELTYIVENSEGCSDTATATIQVIPEAASFIFSPNGDGKNDFFTIGHAGNYKKANLRVFNLLGSLIYENGDYRNNWSAEGISNGVYLFVAEIPELNKVYQGKFSICR